MNTETPIDIMGSSSAKSVNRITVQKIIDEADVGRSTFYAHFETKDLLLDAMCQDLFYHIFENDPCPWVGKDNELESMLTHILWHIRDNKNDISGILLSDSGDIFMSYFRDHLHTVFEHHIHAFHADVPKEFLLNHLSGSFAETVRWWLKEGLKTSPESAAGYFMQMTETH